MSGTHFERHLVIGAEIDGLDVAPRAQIPEMKGVAVFIRQQVLRDNSVLELRRQRPLAGHHVIARQIPPEIVMPGLRTAVDLPATEDLEGLAIHDEHAWRTVRAILAAAAERADVNAFRSAMDGVRPRVARLLEHFLRFDDLVNLRLGRVGLVSTM